MSAARSSAGIFKRLATDAGIVAAPSMRPAAAATTLSRRPLARAEAFRPVGGVIFRPEPPVAGPGGAGTAGGGVDAACRAARIAPTSAPPKLGPVVVR